MALRMVLAQQCVHAAGNLDVVVCVEVGKRDAHAAFGGIESGAVHEHDTLLPCEVVEKLDVGDFVAEPRCKIIAVATGNERERDREHIVTNAAQSFMTFHLSLSQP